MTIPVEQLESAVEQLFRTIAEQLPDILQIQANDLKAKIRDRLQQKGIDAKGNALPEYSESYRKVKAERYGEESVSHRNYTATGEMFREWQITGVNDSGTSITVEVSGRTTAAQDKFDYNSIEDRRDITAPSEQEEADVATIMDETIQEIINELGF